MRYLYTMVVYAHGSLFTGIFDRRKGCMDRQRAPCSTLGVSKNCVNNEKDGTAESNYCQ